MLLTEVLLAGVLPSVVLPALVGKTVLAVSGLLEKKEKTPPELETPEEEGELPLFWPFVPALAPLVPFLFGWLDWGASAL